MRSPLLLSILAIAATCTAQFEPEQCGAEAGNQKCKQNKCCSQYGWCGTSEAYCQAAEGCQAGFGRCTGSVPSSPVVPGSPTPSISKNGRCGSAFGGQTCKSSIFGDCCSTYNWCGKTTGHCKASRGCQPGFGTCTGTQSSSMLLPVSKVPSQSSSLAFIAAASSATPTSVLVSSSVVVHSTSGLASSSSSVIASASSLSALSSSAVSGSTSSIASMSFTASSISSSPAATGSMSSPASSLTSSMIITSSSGPLASSVISSAASTSASGPPTIIRRNLRASRDPSIVRTASSNVVPKNALSFFFAEDGTSYTTSVKANLDSGATGVLLENIAGVSSVGCSGSTLNLQFSDEATLNAARNWPAGTIVFTLSDSCNSATERGVYKIGNTVAPQLRQRQTNNVYQLSLAVLLSRMEAVIANYEELKRQAAEAATIASSASPLASSLASPSVSPAASSSATSQTSASASALPSCGGYAPGGRFDISGTSYQISCTLAGTWRERWIDITYLETFTACMAFCNTNPQCKVASWNVQQVQNGKFMCLRWPVLPYKTDNAVDSPMAVKVVAGSSSLSLPATLVTSAVSVSSSASSP